MTDAHDVIARQLTRSGEIFLLAMEPLDEGEFFAENGDGFSAAWVTGHLACVADLFSSWSPGCGLLLGEDFHAIFNETAAIPGRPESKAESADRAGCSKAYLLLTFRQAAVKALAALRAYGSADWDAPAPSCAPVTMRAGGDTWEDLGAHIYWHCGQLAGSMPRFRGTYALGLRPHHLYLAPHRQHVPPEAP